LIIGSVLGLTQYRIKRLFAYSTISHLGFILLALSINSIESIQAFYFYLIQYSITNLNAFMILIGIGYSFLMLTNKNINNVSIEKDFLNVNTTSTSYLSQNVEKPLDNYILSKNNNEKYINKANLDHKIDSFSPIQLISQLKGFFFINPVLAISLAVTLFSFLGVPPLLGFFAKQMVLSAALDSGYIFMTLIAILTSVIGAVYYLAIIKELFFEKNEYKTSPLKTLNTNQLHTIFLSGSLTIIISILTLFILGFMFIPKEFMYLTSILSLVI
jgi:NADH-ubiquinone oxidoreductase chain 2